MSVALAEAAGGGQKRGERQVLRDTGRHGCAPRLARLPQGILRVVDRLRLVA